LGGWSTTSTPYIQPQAIALRGVIQADIDRWQTRALRRCELHAYFLRLSNPHQRSTYIREPERRNGSFTHLTLVVTAPKRRRLKRSTADFCRMRGAVTCKAERGLPERISTRIECRRRHQPWPLHWRRARRKPHSLWPAGLLRPLFAPHSVPPSPHVPCLRPHRRCRRP